MADHVNAGTIQQDSAVRLNEGSNESTSYRDQGRACLSAAKVQFKSGAYAEAFSLAIKGAAILPESSGNLLRDSLSIAAQAALLCGQPSKALKHASRMVCLQPQDPASRTLVRMCTLEMEHEARMHTLQAALSPQPADSDQSSPWEAAGATPATAATDHHRRIQALIEQLLEDGGNGAAGILQELAQEASQNVDSQIAFSLASGWSAAMAFFAVAPQQVEELLLSVGTCQLYQQHQQPPAQPSSSPRLIRTESSTALRITRVRWPQPVLQQLLTLATDWRRDPELASLSMGLLAHAAQDTLVRHTLFVAQPTWATCVPVPALFSPLPSLDGLRRPGSGTSAASLRCHSDDAAASAYDSQPCAQPESATSTMGIILPASLGGDEAAGTFQSLGEAAVGSWPMAGQETEVGSWTAASQEAEGIPDGVCSPTTPPRGLDPSSELIGPEPCSNPRGCLTDATQLRHSWPAPGHHHAQGLCSETTTHNLGQPTHNLGQPTHHLGQLTSNPGQHPRASLDISSHRRTGCKPFQSMACQYGVLEDCGTGDVSGLIRGSCGLQGMPSLTTLARGSVEAGGSTTTGSGTPTQGTLLLGAELSLGMWNLYGTKGSSGSPPRPKQGMLITTEDDETSPTASTASSPATSPDTSPITSPVPALPIVPQWRTLNPEGGDGGDVSVTSRTNSSCSSSGSSDAGLSRGSTSTEEGLNDTQQQGVCITPTGRVSEGGSFTPPQRTSDCGSLTLRRRTSDCGSLTPPHRMSDCGSLTPPHRTSDCGSLGRQSDCGSTGRPSRYPSRVTGGMSCFALVAPAADMCVSPVQQQLPARGSVLTQLVAGLRPAAGGSGDSAAELLPLPAACCAAQLLNSFCSDYHSMQLLASTEQSLAACLAVHQALHAPGRNTPSSTGIGQGNTSNPVLAGNVPGTAINAQLSPFESIACTRAAGELCDTTGCTAPCCAAARMTISCMSRLCACVPSAAMTEAFLTSSPLLPTSSSSLQPSNSLQTANSLQPTNSLQPINSLQPGGGSRMVHCDSSASLASMVSRVNSRALPSGQIAPQNAAPTALLTTLVQMTKHEVSRSLPCAQPEIGWDGTTKGYTQGKRATDPCAGSMSELQPEALRPTATGSSTQPLEGLALAAPSSLLQAWLQLLASVASVGRQLSRELYRAGLTDVLQDVVTQFRTDPSLLAAAEKAWAHCCKNCPGALDETLDEGRIHGLIGLVIQGLQRVVQSPSKVDQGGLLPSTPPHVGPVTPLLPGGLARPLSRARLSYDSLSCGFTPGSSPPITSMPSAPAASPPYRGRRDSSGPGNAMYYNSILASSPAASPKHRGRRSTDSNVPAAAAAANSAAAGVAGAVATVVGGSAVRQQRSLHHSLSVALRALDKLAQLLDSCSGADYLQLVRPPSEGGGGGGSLLSLVHQLLLTYRGNSVPPPPPPSDSNPPSPAYSWFQPPSRTDSAAGQPKPLDALPSTPRAADTATAVLTEHLAAKLGADRQAAKSGDACAELMPALCDAGSCVLLGCLERARRAADLSPAEVPRVGWFGSLPPKEVSAIEQSLRHQFELLLPPTTPPSTPPRPTQPRSRSVGREEDREGKQADQEQQQKRVLKSSRSLSVNRRIPSGLPPAASRAASSIASFKGRSGAPQPSRSGRSPLGAPADEEPHSPTRAVSRPHDGFDSPSLAHPLPHAARDGYEEPHSPTRPIPRSSEAFDSLFSPARLFARSTSGEHEFEPPCSPTRAIPRLAEGGFDADGVREIFSLGLESAGLV